MLCHTLLFTQWCAVIPTRTTSSFFPSHFYLPVYSVISLIVSNLNVTFSRSSLLFLRNWYPGVFEIFFVRFLFPFLYILPRENRDARNLLTKDERIKKKKKELKKKKKKEKPEHLNWAPKLPLCSLCFFQLRIFAPVKSHLPRYYVQEQRQLKTKKKKREKCKDLKRKKKKKKATVCHNNEK